MSRFSPLAWLVLPLILVGCADDIPVFGAAVPLPVPEAGDATGPRLSTGSDGRLTLSWMTSSETGTALKYSTYRDSAFAPALEVVTDPRMFVNWADLPSVSHIAGSHWVAHWLRYSADKTYSYDVAVSQSHDDGQTWSKPLVVHDDGTPTEHGFVSLHRAADGVALLWLDGRDTGKDTADNVLAASMTLRSAVLTPSGEIVREESVDDSVCDCCQTDVALASSGLIAVYRDRTASETRDIYVTRQVDGRWQPGERLYPDDWVIPGCPVNGPSIAARDDRVAVAWFSAARDVPVIRVIVSNDSGATFGEPIDIARGKLAGYVGLALLEDDSLAVSWVSRDASGNNRLNLRHVSAHGELGTSQRVAAIRQLHVVPQLGFHDGSLLLVWTDEDEGTRRLEGVSVPVNRP